MKRKVCFVLLSTLFVFSTFVLAQEKDGFEIDVSIDKGDDATYYDNESIFISFRTNDDAYVIIYNIDTQGNINLIYPESNEKNAIVAAYKMIQIPEEDDDFSYRVTTGPSGEEFICAGASTERMRIPVILRGNTRVQVEGDPVSVIEDITEEIISSTHGEYSTDICHFYVADHEEEFPPFPPFPHFPVGCALKVVSKPMGAKVFIDGRYFGKTPTIIGGIPPGLHRVVVRKKYYYQFEEEVFLDGGEREYLRVHLEWKLW